MPEAQKLRGDPLFRQRQIEAAFCNLIWWWAWECTRQPLVDGRGLFQKMFKNLHFRRSLATREFTGYRPGTSRPCSDRRSHDKATPDITDRQKPPATFPPTKQRIGTLQSAPPSCLPLFPSIQTQNVAISMSHQSRTTACCPPKKPPPPKEHSAKEPNKIAQRASLATISSRN